MKKNWLVALVFLVIMIIILRMQGKSLVTPVSPLGIIDLEFARTAERLQQLKLFWNPRDLVMNIYLDFLLIMSYVWFLSAAAYQIQKHSGWEKAGKWAITLAIASGLFDVLENFLMVMIYQGRFDPVLLQFVFFLAIMKFALVLLVIFFLLASLPLILFKKPGRFRGSRTYF